MSFTLADLKTNGGYGFPHQIVEEEVAKAVAT